MLLKKIYKDTFWVVTAQITGVVIAIGINAILTRYLSKSDFGNYQLALAYVNIANFLTLPGFNQSILKGSSKNYDNIYTVTLRYRAFASLFGVMVFLCIGSFFIFFWHKQTLGILLLIGSIFFPLYPLQQWDALLMGKRRFGLSRSLFVFFQLLRLLFIGLSAVITRNLKIIFIMTIVAQAIYTIIGFIITSKIINRSSKDVKIEKGLIKLGIKMTFIGVFSIIAKQLERIILGMMDPKLLAVYHIGANIPFKIKENTKPILSVPTIHWIPLTKEKNLVKIKKNWWIFILFGSVSTLILWFLSPYFIPFLFGRHYIESVMITKWLSITLSFLFFQTMLLNVAVYQGEENFFMKLSIGQSILKIGLFSVLIPYFKLIGVLISIISSEVIIFVISLFWFIHKIKNMSIKT